jgi:hypothetical protein
VIKEKDVLKIKDIQTILGVLDDGLFWAASRAALQKVVLSANAPDGIVDGMASSFADPADVASFRRCKAKGKTDKACFKVGDNGIGLWGDDTTVTKPYCALPRDVWAHLGTKARGAKVNVVIAGKLIVCELRDTLPARKNLINKKVVIDLNPGALKLFGLKPPTMVPVRWSWV